MGLDVKVAAQRSGRIVYIEVLTLVLSVYSLAALTAELVADIEPGMKRLMSAIDYGVCAVFLTDFVVHLARAPRKAEFMKWGWIDLLSSLPAVEWLRWGRAFRVFRILRALRSFNTVAESLSLNRVQGTFGVVTIVSGVAALLSTLAVLHFEQHAPGGNIRTAEDALWWAFVSLTTIGYGDLYPVTAGGRLVAVLLVICGLSVFGTFTAYIASFFVGTGQQKEEVEIRELAAEVRQLREKVEELIREEQDKRAGGGPGGGAAR